MPDESPLAEKTVALLLAELSRGHDVHLVEREQIGEVLRELKLGPAGLLSDASRLRLGAMLAAETFIYIDGHSKASSSTVRIRLIETRTGIILWTGFHSGPQPLDAAKVVTELKRARHKLPASDQKRCYVGIMGIVNEQYDDSLAETAQALRAFLEHDLRSNSNCILLEREQLDMLAKEQDLTGIELQLRASSILVEGGLRRSEDKKGVEIAFKLRRADGTPMKGFSLTSHTADAQEIRSIIFGKLLEEFGAADAQRIGNEAEQFAARADWLLSHRRFDQAFENACAAAALNPSHANFSRLRILHTEMCYQLQARLQWTNLGFHQVPDRQQTFKLLASAIHHAKLAHQYEEKQIRIAIQTSENPHAKVWSDGSLSSADPFDPHVPICRFVEPPELQAERAALDEIRLAKFEHLRRTARGFPLLQLLLGRMHLAAYFAQTPEAFSRDVLALQKEIDEAILQRYKDSEFRTYGDDYALASALTLQTHLSRQRFQSELSNAWYAQRRPWSQDVFVPIWRSLEGHKRLAIRFLILCHQATLVDDPKKLEQVLALVREYPFLASSRGTDLLGKSGKLIPIIDSLVQSAEKSGDSSALIQYEIGSLVMRLLPKQRTEWSQRILPLLDEKTVEKSLIERMRSLQIALQRHVPEKDRNEPVPPDKLSGPWSHFTQTAFQPMPFGKHGPSGGCFGIHPETGEPVLVLHWSHYAEGYAPEHLQLITFGEKARHSSLIKLPCTDPLVKQLMTAETTPAGVYYDMWYRQLFASVYPQLDSMSPGNLRYAHALRWHGSHLYLGFHGGFSVFDSMSKQTRDIATSLRVDNRNPLDSTNAYLINNILIAPNGKYLFFNVERGGQDGIWRYVPENNTITRVVTGSTKIYHWDDGKLFFEQNRKEGTWHLLDPNTLAVGSLSGYREMRQGKGWGPHLGTIKLGPYLITRDGFLLTNDGLQYKYPLQHHWDLLQPTRRGFIAATLDSQHCSIWQFDFSGNLAQAGSGEPIDLLTQIDLARDKIRGSWKIENGILVSPSTKGISKLHLPCVVPDGFDFNLILSPQVQNPDSLAAKGGLFITIAAREAYFYVALDFKSQQDPSFYSGVGLLDEKGVVRDENRTSDRVLKPGARSNVTIRVRRGHVEVIVNEKVVSTWRGDFKNLSPAHWMKSTDRPLALAAENYAYEIHELNLIPQTSDVP